MKPSNSKFAICTVLAVLLLIVALVFALNGFNKINEYRGPENIARLPSVNAYVNGDAYNYIINGTYFAGYMAFSGGCIVGACVFFAFALFFKPPGNPAQNPFSAHYVGKEQLEEYERLLKQGLITQQEYDQKKQQLITPKTS